jgi:exopolysaccharide biosynthesis protein
LETTSHFADKKGVVFAVNGDYACQDTGNTAIRSGIVYTDKNCNVPAVYNAHTGIFNSPTNLGIRGQLFSDLVKEKKVTDSFTFWSWVVVEDGEIVEFNDSSRTQRTVIGSNGKPGEIIIVVSEGRYADGESAGLTLNQCGKLMKNLGCTTAVPLDGGGSSTMYFNGKILNSAKGNERPIRDFVYLKSRTPPIL